MNLIDENEEKEQAANKKKLFTIIIATIAVLVVVAIILVIYSTIKNNNTLKLKVDNTDKTITSGLFRMADSKNLYVDENNQIYVSVKKLSALLGVEYYNDEYKSKGEDTTKCYIRTSNEYTSYISNSSKIYKAVILDEQQESGTSTTSSSKNNKQEVQKVTEYEYFEVENGVQYIDGEIYASQEAIELGFNIQLSYNPSNKTISIYTLDALQSIADNNLKKASVTLVIGDECSYQNKKLLKYGLALIKISEDNYGITNYLSYSDGNNVVSPRYSSIRFCESSETVIVTTSSDSKQGILKLDLNNLKEATTLIAPNYQLIRRMDEDLNLYLIKESGRYGIIELEGETVTTVLRSEYQKIGIDNLYDNMDNKYVINSKYIPVQIDNNWGIVTIEGNLLIKPQYPDIGCNLGETGSGDGVIVLPELVNGIDGIVFLTDAENKLYSIINVQDCTQIGISASEIYSKYENNERIYYMKITSSNNQAMRISIYDFFGKKVENADNLDDDSLNNNVNKNNIVSGTNSTNNITDSNNSTNLNNTTNTGNTSTNLVNVTGNSISTNNMN